LDVSIFSNPCFISHLGEQRNMILLFIFYISLLSIMNRCVHMVM